MMALSLRFVLIVGGSAAYLGLAIPGRGGFAAFFSHPALVALAVTLFALTGVAFFAGGNISPGVREDRGNRRVLAAFGVVGLLPAVFLPAWSDRIDTVGHFHSRCARMLSGFKASGTGRSQAPPEFIML